MRSGGFFRKARITILLGVLFFVSMNSWLTRLRSTDWNEALWVVVYPVNGDNSPVSQAYIDTLSADSFNSVESFLANEAQRYGKTIVNPVTVRLAPPVNALPPQPPINGSTLSVMIWSLKLRYWAWRNDNFGGPQPDVQMFVVYHDPGTHTRLRHSLGLQKGMIGVVNAYASRTMVQRNNIIIAHEFLHTLGASDKYDRNNNQPLYPDGYTEPDKSPLFPQQTAEVMAGRIPLSRSEAVMPASAAGLRIGSRTAREINWIN
ncbi:MAG: hypothetical protein BMS9Abin08_1677 [Gammaproteobacteria bacterium]|nr:MAG: hypothetical protein BMS9Abin08_1677 [Gammaproteobacteria bacterium]